MELIKWQNSKIKTFNLKKWSKYRLNLRLKIITKTISMKFVKKYEIYQVAESEDENIQAQEIVESQTENNNETISKCCIIE